VYAGERGEALKIYRFRYRKRILTGILKEEFLFPIVGSIFGDFRIGTSPVPIGDVRVLPPVLPSKIVGIGRNYRDHAQELGNAVPEEPLVFLKPSTAVIGHLDRIVAPAAAGRIDYEGELAVVIKKKARDLGDDASVSDVILGYACFNDITARDLQKKDVQFTRAKSFDTFAAVGPCVATGLDPAAIHLKTFLNGKLVQTGNTANLIFSVPFLVRFLSRIMTLNPGDIIATGTPAGVGPMSPGDRVDVQIEGVGVLSNTLSLSSPKEDT
jgi:2-keto-4-pentenoate hydratase/2-oxohepta-3-ene-1,7-dioic acid hydratase in catechol pathway